MPKSTKQTILSKESFSSEAADYFYTHILPSTYSGSLGKVFEIVDNPIDIGATTIKIYYNKKKKRLIVEDNGIGIKISDIQDMMRLGYTRERKPSDIGNFGSGFKGACQALCLQDLSSKVTIITTYNGKTYSIDWELKKSPKDFELCELEDFGHVGTTVTLYNIEDIITEDGYGDKDNILNTIVFINI